VSAIQTATKIPISERSSCD